MYDSERSMLVRHNLSPEESAKYFGGIVKLHALEQRAAKLTSEAKEAEALSFAAWDKCFTELLIVERDIAELTLNLINFELKAKEEADNETEIILGKIEESCKNKINFTV